MHIIQWTIVIDPDSRLDTSISDQAASIAVHKVCSSSLSELGWQIFLRTSHKSETLAGSRGIIISRRAFRSMTNSNNHDRMSTDGSDPSGSQSPDSPHSWRIVRPFGTGVKRKHIHFVPASAEDQEDNIEQTARDIQLNRGSSVADFYLSLVLPPGPGPANVSPSRNSTPSNQSQNQSTEPSPVNDSSGTARIMMPSRRDHATSKQHSSRGLGVPSGLSDSLDTPEEVRRDAPAGCLSEDTAIRPASAAVEHPIETPTAVDEICPTCKSRVTNWESHVRTTAHMFSLEHSKTPHHLNRQSEGYKHMVKLGWDPDGCEGLGTEGQGIRFPVKATSKTNNLGIGAKPSKSIRDNADSVSDTNPKRQRLLTAKQMQRLEKAERAARQDLHDYLRH